MTGKSLTRAICAALLFSLIAAATALAAGSSLKLSGPKKKVHLNSTYTVKASGKAGKATNLYAYEGGYTTGSQPAIQCKSTEQAEHQKYPTSVYLGSYAVHGNFHRSWKFTAGISGHKAFCAYLANSNGSHTYAHASLHWENVS